MKFGHNSKQVLAGLTFGFFVVTGTYNAIVINSESQISGADVRLTKRLDEVYGNLESKREVAASISWQKLSVKQAAVQRTHEPESFQASQTPTPEASNEVVSQAAVQEDLSLNLTSVINPKKWQQGLKEGQFNGNLTTNQGVIENLNVSLPNGEGVSVSFSEMSGNVFEYDYEGELYSGMMYQEGNNSYVVNLTNGPLEGTRLTFKGEPSVEDQIQLEETQRALAENQQAEAGIQTEVAQTAEAPAEQMVEQPVEAQQPMLEQSEVAAQDMYAQEQGQLEQQQQIAPEQTLPL